MHPAMPVGRLQAIRERRAFGALSLAYYQVDRSFGWLQFLVEPLFDYSVEDFGRLDHGQADVEFHRGLYVSVPKQLPYDFELTLMFLKKDGRRRVPELMRGYA